MGERRQLQRHSYPYLVQMTPVDDNGVALVDLSMVVVGKHLSEKGLDFFHEHPIAYKQVIISLEPNIGDPISVLLELTWCRFTKKGWYDSGGRFLRVLEKS